MNLQILRIRSVRAAVFGFIGLLGLVALFALARGMGVINAAVTRRATGLLIGIMIVITGNLVPKLRPLNSPSSNPAEAGAAERLAGWTLVLAGIAYIGLFAFAPLGYAARFSSFVGMGAIAVIAVNWTWLARDTLFGRARSAEDMLELSEQAVQKRNVMIWLLFGLLYVLVGTWVAFLVHDNIWGRELASWMILVFGTLYAILYAVLESRRSSRRCSRRWHSPGGGAANSF